MAKYKISVVVPTYNSGLFLNAFFDSIMYQSIGFENIEVIFVDEGKIILTSSADELRNKENASIDEIFRRYFKC